MFRGGVADKLGNEYEGDWALSQALKVIHGLADAIRIEPINDDAGGFEFWLKTGDAVEWHQCKSRTTRGSWTINALHTEGVLRDFARKLAHEGATCVFISSDPAQPFKGLVEKAAIVDDEGVFTSELNEEEEKGLRTLTAIWAVDVPTAFQWLRRCRVEVTSRHSVQSHNRSLCSLLFQEETSSSIPRLKSLLVDRLTQTLTTDSLRHAVEGIGLSWIARLDATLDQAFKEATSSYLNTLNKPIVGGRIETSATADAVATVLAGDEKLLVVTGQAGAGKSDVIAAVIEAALRAEWPVLSLRIDRQLSAISVMDFGEALLERRQNPVGLLGNRFIKQPTLLVLDQVDAVSEASGRSARSRDLLFELIRFADHYPSMKVVLACRKYDLENDRNLTQLTEGVRAKTVEVNPLNWDEHVMPVLARLGLEKRLFSEREQRLLAVPINLYLLGELASAGAAPAGEISQARLFDALLALRSKEFQNAGLSWTPAQALGLIADSMSASQELTASEGVINHLPGAVQALSSAGLITCVKGRVQFSHESFFDHAYATRFISSGQAIIDLLLSDEQRLFRRTQVRQLFARLRDLGVNRRYIRNLTEVMTSPDVRFLVKDAICSWLGTVEDPDQKELELVLSCLQPDNPLRTISANVLFGPHWLSPIVQARLIQTWLGGADGDLQERAFFLLRQNDTRAPDLVAAELLRWWQRRPDRAHQLVMWLENLHPDGEVAALESLYFEVIAAASVEEFPEGNVPERPMGSWTHGDAARGARVLGMWLKRWFELFPMGHPFGYYIKPNDGYWIAEIANKSPEAFLRQVLPHFIEGVCRDNMEISTGKISYSQLRSSLDSDDDEDDVDGPGLNSYPKLLRKALRSLAASAPERAAAILDVTPSEYSLLLFLHLEAIAANGQALAQRLPRLIVQKDLLSCGPYDAPWLPFAAAARAAVPYLSSDITAEIEQIVFKHRPEMTYALETAKSAEGRRSWERPPGKAKYIVAQLNSAGLVEHAILRTIGPEKLSPIALARLAELDRKFPGKSMPERRGMRAGWIESPVKPEAAARMTNAHWLTAMERYSTDGDRRFVDGRLKGGCRELANQLQIATKEDPGRFLALFDTMSFSLNGAYPAAIIRGLSDTQLSTDQALRAGEIALRWPKEIFERDLSWFARRHPAAADNLEFFNLLVDTAENGEASDTIVTSNRDAEHRSSNLREVIGYGGDLESSGLNSGRGAAFEAIGSIIWASDRHLEQAIALAEKQIQSEPLVSVLMQMPHLLNSISKYDRERGLALIEKLGQRDLRAFNTRAGSHVLRWAVHNHFERMWPLVERLSQAEPENIRALGFFLISGFALHDMEAEQIFKGMWEKSELARRVAGFRGSGNVGVAGVSEVAARWVTELFFDMEKAVRDEASHCNWERVLDDPDALPDVAVAYLASPTFDDHPDRFVTAIADRVDVYPALAFETARQIIVLLEKAEPNDRHRHSASIFKLGTLLVNLYRAFEADPAKEKQMLDLFDRYLQSNTYNMREAIAKYERH